MASLHDELAELAAECAPRRFALCWLDAEDQDGGVLAWGLAFPNGAAVAIGDGGDPVVGRFVSAESACRFLGRGEDAVLVWLDAPTSNEGPPPGLL